MCCEGQVVGEVAGEQSIMLQLPEASVPEFIGQLLTTSYIQAPKPYAWWTRPRATPPLDALLLPVPRKRFSKEHAKF